MTLEDAGLRRDFALQADEQPKRRPGRPTVYGKRQVFSFRITEKAKARVIESATRNGRSLSEEIEHCLNRYHDIEEAHREIKEARCQARAWADALRVHAIRAAGLEILREIDGKPTRVIVDLEMLLTEAEFQSFKGES